MFFSFWRPYDSDVGMFQVVPEFPKPLLIFLNSCFFILFWLDVSFFLLFQIIDMSPEFLPFTVASLYVLLYFMLGSLHLFFHFVTVLNQFCEHTDYQCLNSASDRLAMSLSLSSFSGALVCSFIWAIFLCLSAPVIRLHLGGALAIDQQEASLSVVCGTVCGGGVREGTILLACYTLAPLSKELLCETGSFSCCGNPCNSL